MPIRIVRLLACLFLFACAQNSQNRYSDAEVGKSRIVEFGTVISKREVAITGKNTGTSALIGGAAGAGAGSYIGSGSGSLWAAGGGAILGAVGGSIAEQAASNRKGTEYIVTKTTGQTITVVQNIAEDDKAINPGDRVIVQTSGSYQRVLPAANLPTSMPQPQGLKFTR